MTRRSIDGAAEGAGARQYRDPLRGYIAGLTLSTAGGSATFTAATGEAADSTNADLRRSSPALAKTAAWTVGAGGALTLARSARRHRIMST
jgi:hypothetical protein